MTDTAIGIGNGRASIDLHRLLAGRDRLLRRLHAWQRLNRRRATLVRELGMLDARDRDDVGLPPPRQSGLEYVARMFMMR